jgi:lipopolysaccharide export system permease protein
MILRALDRYVLGSWVRIFVLTSLGFPLVSIMINLTDNLNKLLDRGLTMQQIAWSYVYSIPENMFIVMPAAVLFATVFTVGAMGRYSELTAAKASGQSFHRLMLPVFVAAACATGLAFMVGEMAPGATAKEQELQKSVAARPTRSRFNFVYRGDQGWVYTIRSLDVINRQLKQIMFERQGEGAEYPAMVITADSASWDTTRQMWRVREGASRLIDALRRSGNDANKLIVERALKVALPATCLIIALFGAPLGITNPRAGAAVGIALSLGTTVLFLLLTQIMKAVGSGGVVDPVVAAWLPNLVFLAAGLVLLARTRT